MKGPPFAFTLHPSLFAADLSKPYRASFLALRSRFR